MPLYVSRYSLPSGESFHTQVYARDEEHLHEVLKKRGMNEERAAHFEFGMEPPRMPSEYFDEGNYKQMVHTLTWVCMIAARGGIVDAWDILNDKGILHEATHMLAFGYTNGGPLGNLNFRLNLVRFERKVPGVHPRWGDADWDRKEEARQAQRDVDDRDKQWLAGKRGHTIVHDAYATAMSMSYVDLARIKDYARQATVSMDEFKAALYNTKVVHPPKPKGRTFKDTTAMQSRADQDAARKANIEKFLARKRPKLTVDFETTGGSNGVTTGRVVARIEDSLTFMDFSKAEERIIAYHGR